MSRTTFNIQVDAKEMMEVHGAWIDHTNIYRWVQKFAPRLEAKFRKSKSGLGQ